MSTPNNIWEHDPDARLDYTWDWTAFLADGETIASAEIIPADGITASDTDHDEATVTTWITTTLPAGQTHEVVCHMTTSAGRIDDRKIKLTIRER